MRFQPVAGFVTRVITILNTYSAYDIFNSMIENVIFLRSYAFMAQIDQLLDSIEQEYLAERVDKFAAQRSMDDLSRLLSVYPDLATTQVMNKIRDISGRFAARRDL